MDEKNFKLQTLKWPSIFSTLGPPIYKHKGKIAKNRTLCEHHHSESRGIFVHSPQLLLLLSDSLSSFTNSHSTYSLNALWCHICSSGQKSEKRAIFRLLLMLKSLFLGFFFNHCKETCASLAEEKSYKIR